jgi:hypothetical protein
MDEKWHILFTGNACPVNTSIDKPIINTSDIFKIFQYVILFCIKKNSKGVVRMHLRQLDI